MDYTTVIEINAKYIFVKNDGKEDKTPTKKADLLELLENFDNDFCFYNRMALESEKTYTRINAKLESLKIYEKRLESIIEEHKEEPLYKRGLADTCFSLKNTKENIKRTLYELSGIRMVKMDARQKENRAEKMIHIIKNILKTI